MGLLASPGRREPSTKTSFLTAISWTTVSTAATNLLAFLRSLILARLLNPDAYGLFGMGMLVFSALSAFTDFNLGSYVISRKFETSEQKHIYADTVWTADLIRRILVSLALLGMAWPASWFFGDARLFPVLAIISVTPAITGLTNIGLILLQKEISFRVVTYQKLATDVSTTVLTICVALVTHNVWALVFSQVAGATLGVAFSWWLQSYRPRFTFDRTAFRESFNFGRHMMVISMLTFVTTEFDNLVVGRYLGTAVLGAYLLAYRLANLPVEVMSGIMASVVFPTYAKINAASEDRLGPVFAQITAACMVILLAVLLPLKLAAAEVIRFLYGHKWDAAIPVLGVLVFVGLFRGMARLISPILMATGRADLDAKAKMIEAAVFIPATLLLVPRMGMMGAAWAGVLSYFLAFFIRLVFAMRRMRTGISGMIITFGTPILVGVIAWTAGSFLKQTAGVIAALLGFELLFCGMTIGLNRDLRKRIVEIWQMVSLALSEAPALNPRKARRRASTPR